MNLLSPAQQILQAPRHSLTSPASQLIFFLPKALQHHWGEHTVPLQACFHLQSHFSPLSKVNLRLKVSKKPTC